jgi:hypothetical protein
MSRQQTARGLGSERWVLVLALVNLILAGAILWFAVSQGWP